MPQTTGRIWDKPVAWLVGRDLLGGIKGILLYAAYGSKLDPRDWMAGKVESFSADNDEAFWFDYMADAGDGTKAMYTIAYLAMSDLWVQSEAAGHQVFFEREKDGVALPRGEFLFIGGDTAYHVADYLTLVDRMRRPFAYAYEDLSKHASIEERPVFGIPGNHDYYDQLDGFRRQFRKPTRPEPPPPPPPPETEDMNFAQLGLAGFKRVQQASYLAVQLPFGWWLWGLDTETGPLDNRQEKFFSEAAASVGEKDPQKLIIATCSPSTAFGKVADRKADFKATQAMQKLLGDEKLPDGKKRPEEEQPQPFLPTGAPGSYNFSTTGDAQMKPGECRLDLSGDVHQYARYWGPASSSHPRACVKRDTPRPEAKSYASVVSGLGGAFHHPSNTFDDELQEQVLYPDEKTSRAAVGKELFKFWSIWDGGYVWLFGFIIAFVIYFAASVTQSSRQFLTNITVLSAPQQTNDSAPERSLHLTQRETILPTTGLSPNGRPCDPVTSFPLWRWLGISDTWTPPVPEGQTECNPAQPYYFYGISFLWKYPYDLAIGTILIFISLGLTIVTAARRTWLFGPKETDPKEKVEYPARPDRKLIALVPIIVGTVLLGMVTVQRYDEHIVPFVCSLMVLFTIVIAAGGIVLTTHYNDYLFIKVHREKVTRLDRIWPWVLPIMSVLVLAAGLWSFGRNNLPALLIVDMLFTLIFVGAFVGLIVLPATSASGELLYTSSKPIRIAGSLLIGFWHACLQVFVPFVLVRRGSWLTLIVLIVLLLAFTFWPGPQLFKSNRRFVLALVWLVYGAAILALPWLTAKPGSHVGSSLMSSIFFDWPTATGGIESIRDSVRSIFPSFVAGFIGAVMSCLWFGWYLGVCSVFNGHNNEVGGAARIEQFKQFIRFKVTPNELTAYVIAVDDVSKIGERDDKGVEQDGRVLKPKLIDVFTLRPKPLGR